MPKNTSKHARNNSDSTARGKKKVEWKGYVNWQLTEVHKKAFDSWIASNPNIDTLMDNITRDGYDLKVRHDDYNDCKSAQLYCTNPDSENAGWCLSMRGKDWWTATLRVLYVHAIALNGVWGEQGIDGWTDDKW